MNPLVTFLKFVLSKCLDNCDIVKTSSPRCASVCNSLIFCSLLYKYIQKYLKFCRQKNAFPTKLFRGPQNLYVLKRFCHEMGTRSVQHDKNMYLVHWNELSLILLDMTLLILPGLCPSLPMFKIRFVLGGHAWTWKRGFRFRLQLCNTGCGRCRGRYLRTLFFCNLLLPLFWIYLKMFILQYKIVAGEFSYRTLS